MCDYSLMGVPNRLAEPGESLVAHRFRTGSLGLASAAEVALVTAAEQARDGLWSALRRFFRLPAEDGICAVCIPPGARLELTGIPLRLQLHLRIGPVEEVTFTQITAAQNEYRDAVRFTNGRELRFQQLREGLCVRVLDLVSAEETVPEAVLECR